MGEILPGHNIWIIMRRRQIFNLCYEPESLMLILAYFDDHAKILQWKERNSSEAEFCLGWNMLGSECFRKFE